MSETMASGMRNATAQLLLRELEELRETHAKLKEEVCSLKEENTNLKRENFRREVENDELREQLSKKPKVVEREVLVLY